MKSLRDWTLPVQCLLISLVLTPALSAGAMTKNIEAVRPRIGQRGTTVEVRIQGVSLKNPREVVFFKPGITASNIRVSPEPPAMALALKSGNFGAPDFFSKSIGMLP